MTDVRGHWTVWLATGFGLGFSPIAPGTVGTLLGIPWTYAITCLPSVGWQWVVIAVTLLSSAFFLGFWHWWTAVGIAFGIPEAFGTWKQDDAYPPLTHVIVRFTHIEIALPLLQGVGASIGAFWFGFAHPGRMGAFAGVLAWLNAHFIPRFLDR